MIRDLPKNVPSIVMSAAHGALEDTKDLIGNGQAARKAYASPEYRYLAQDARVAKEAELMGMAQALVEWGAMLQDGLPLAELMHRFKTRTGPDPYLLVARHEIALAARDGFRGGMLRTELRLLLDPHDGLFRHYDWFEGFHVNGGGIVSTQSSIFHGLHPTMLAAIHDRIAEGLVWPLIENDFARLVSAHKDR